MQAGTASYLPPVAQPEIDDADDKDPFEAEEMVMHDHSYDTKSLSPLVENALVYIAGWVVRKIMPTLSCDECRISLVQTATPQTHQQAYHLIKLKQNGGLVVPSEGCISVIMCAEKHLRHLTGTHRFEAGFTKLSLQTKVVAELGRKQVLLDDDHVSNTQEGIDNHKLSLIRSLVGVFYTLRQCHIVKLQNLKSSGPSVRHKLTKTILFKGQ